MTVRQIAYRLQSEGKTELKRDFADVGQAGEAAFQSVGRAADRAGEASDRQMAKWRQMAAAAREVQTQQEQQAKFNAILGVGGGSGKSAQDSAAAFEELLGPVAANGNRKMTNLQRTAIYTASDIVGSAASGINPAVIALQQGPQVLQAIAMEGGAAVSTIVGLGGAIVALTAIVGAGAAAAIMYEGAIHKLDVAANGLGATAGMTGAQLEAMAEGGAKLGNISVAAARDMVAAYDSTGKIGAGVFEQLIGVTQRYADVTGQKAKDATTELGKAFADPVKGADELNAKLHFLDDTTVRYIRDLVAHGRETDAQAVLVERLGQKLDVASVKVDGFAAAWRGVSHWAMDAWNWIGKVVGGTMAGAGVAQQIAELQRQKAQYDAVPDSVVARNYSAELQKRISALQDQWRAQTKGFAEAAANDAAASAREVIAKVTPLPGKLLELQTQRSKLLAGRDDLDPAGQKEADAALKKIDADIRAVSAGYSSAADMASKLKQHTREAAEEARKAAAEAKKRADQEERLETIYAANRLQIAKLRAAGGDPEAKRQLEAAEDIARVQQLINQYLQAGLKLTQARVMAERQVGEEKRAEYEATVAQIEADAEHLKTLGDVLKKGAPVYDENEKAMKALGATAEDVFDKFTDPRNWKNWRDVVVSAIQDIGYELLKLAVLNPIKNAIFSQSNPTAGGGFWSQVFSAVASTASGGFGGGTGAGHNAMGTDNWRGGLTWVGEQGPELVNLPRGSQVFSNANSNMAASPSFHFHIDARGADASAARNVQLSVDRLRAELPGLIVQHTNEGISRGRIK